MGSLTQSSQTNKVEPWGPTANLLRQGYKDMSKQYRQILNNPDKNLSKYVFTEPTFASFGGDTTGALSGISSLARANSGSNGMGGNLQEILNNGGFTQEQLGAMTDTRGLADNSTLNKLISGEGGGLTDDQNLVADRYRGIIDGPIDINANPAYNQVKQNTVDAAAQAVTGQAAKMGRLGGAANQGVLGRETGKIVSDMDLGEYRSQQQRQDQSAGLLAGLSQQGLGNITGAVNQKSGLLSSLFNQSQAGIGNMGAAWDLSMQPYLAQREVGREYDQQAQNVINDKMRIFDAANPMNQTQNYLATLLGAPKNSVTTANPSTLQMLLGGGIGGYGMLKGMGMFGQPTAGAVA